jgi:hypothetical protein
VSFDYDDDYNDIFLDDLNSISEGAVYTMFHRCVGVRDIDIKDPLEKLAIRDSIADIWESYDMEYSRVNSWNNMSVISMKEDTELLMWSVYGVEALDVYSSERTRRNDRVNRKRLERAFEELVGGQ